MGQTVVFTVSLDSDGDVAVARIDPRPPRHPFRDAFGSALRDRHWRIAALFALTAPIAAAAVTFAMTRGAWVTTAYLAAAAAATTASGAWAGAQRTTGDRGERVVQWAVTAILGAALSLAALPGVAWGLARDGWTGETAWPTMVVLALVGAGAAWLGLAFASLPRPWPRAAAAAVVVTLVLAPLGLFAALLPTTWVTEQVTYFTFESGYGKGGPLFVCGKEQAEVTRRHTEGIAPLALVSPALWAVDAASLTNAQLADAPDGSLAQAQAWTRSTRVGPDDFQGYCYQPTSLGVPSAVQERRYEQARPVGAQLAAASALVVGAVSLLLVSRRTSA